MTPHYHKRSNPRRNTPLGKAIAGLLSGRLTVRQVLDGLFGAQSRLGRRITRTLTHGSLVTGRCDLDKPRDLRRRSARRMLAVACMVLERIRFRAGRWRAAGKLLWLGHFARRSGLSIREVARYVRTMAASAAIARIQPPASKVPDWMRSESNDWSAYNVYEVHGLPAPIRERLQAWLTGRAPKRIPPPPPRPAPSAEAIAYAIERVPILAKLMQLATE